MNITQNHFGNLKNGEPVEQYYLTNDHHISVTILSLGATLQSILTPNSLGQLGDILLGFDTIEAYENDRQYMGCVAGPVAGRINHGQYSWQGQTFQLDCNWQEHHLHGGVAGLNRKNWTGQTKLLTDSVKLELTCQAAHGEGGYPGNRTFKTTYILNNKNQLLIYFEATTDRDSPVNMTSHGYFNLSDEPGTIYSHKLMLNALKTLRFDENLIPTGDFDYVLGHPTNFSRGEFFGAALEKMPSGLDHIYVLNKEYGRFGIAAKAIEPESGRTLELVTDQPALVVYTSNFFDGTVAGKKGSLMPRHGAFCLEPQHFPDSVNHAQFPNTMLKAGETYKSHTQLAFGLVGDLHEH